MKILGRILFAFTVAIFLVVFNSVANTTSSNKYFNEEGLKIFQSDSPDRYRIFYGPTGYHTKTATYSFELGGFNINFFEINKVFINKKRRC